MVSGIRNLKSEIWNLKSECAERLPNSIYTAEFLEAGCSALSDSCRLSQQIWKLSRELTTAKLLAVRRDNGEGGSLTRDEQSLVDTFDAGKLHRRLQNLVEEKIPI